MTKAILTELELAFLNMLIKGPKTVKELKDLSGIKSVYFIAEKLVNKELIQKSDDFFSLTEKGRVLVDIF